MESVWITGKRFLSIRRSRFESSRTPYQGILHSTTPSAAGAVPMHVFTGTPVARGEERIGSTIPMPMFAGRPSTMSSTVPVEFLQNSMVGPQRQQISEPQFDKCPTPQSFLLWKIRFKNQVTTCSDFPSETMLWINEVEMVDSLEELKSSRSVCGKNFPNFEMLKAKIADLRQRGGFTQTVTPTLTSRYGS